MEQLTSLVVRAQSGDVDAYGEIVRRFQDMACGYGYSLLGDFHMAEDAAQEAFLAAYRGLTDLREPAAFPGWFRRIVFKHCDRLKRGRALPVVPLDAAGDLPGPDAPPSQAAEDREMQSRVLTAIQALDERERTVTTLFYINGYSQNDIAEFLEVPTGTVKSRLHASRSRLKERMLKMVEDTLHQNAPGDRFHRRVFAELVRDRISLNEGLGGFPVLETPQLVLREMRPEEDAKHWLSVRGPQSPETDFKDTDLSGLVEEFEGVRSRFYDDKYVIYWAITRKGEDRLIGNVRYWEFMGHWNSVHAFVTLQYELAPEYWGQGVGPEAVRAAGEFGIKHLSFARVQCCIGVDDQLRHDELLEAGFTKEGRLRCWWLDNATGQWQDEFMFSLVQSDIEQ